MRTLQAWLSGKGKVSLKKLKKKSFYQLCFLLFDYRLKVHIRQKHGIEVTLEQMEEMRKFYVMRSKLNLVKIS